MAIVSEQKVRGCIPEQHAVMGAASVRSDGELIRVSTGCVERCWTLCPGGLRTVQFSRLDSGTQWIFTNKKQADWQLEPLVGPAVAEGIKIIESSDDGFTALHLQADVFFYYPEADCHLVYRIWCYPGAPGIRTQLLIKGYRSLQHSSEAPSIHVKQGEWEDGILTGIKMVALKLSGLKHGKSYVLAVRMNPNDDGSSQNLKLQTVDGETFEFCSQENQVTDPDVISFQIPEKVFPDGTSDLFISQSGSQVFANLTGAVLYDAELRELARLEPGAAEPPPVIHDVVERIACEADAVSFFGYHSDTQRMNSAETPLLKESEMHNLTASGIENRWASVMTLFDGAGDGLMLVKESHKCVNTTRDGANTGGFIVQQNGAEVTGAGWLPGQLAENAWHPCWATWTILYSGGRTQASLALKQFDRFRYPVNIQRDAYIMANTWGGGRQQAAATEENVLREMAVQAELGIGVQQIDDGWEGPDYVHWRPDPKIYPVGWTRVRAEAERLGLKLGLWFASNLSAQDMLRNRSEGGFEYFKLDFGNFETMDQMERMRCLLRSICRSDESVCRVNWDVTEASPRSGYFWGREFGNVYLENRTVQHPERCVYQPWLVLRDAWHISKHMNLNQFQLTIQNGARINPKISDASLHDPAYLFAQTMMGVPIFFQETQFYSEEDKAVLKPLINIYKQHREKIFSGYTFPIGDEPDNASWSGFQCVLEDRGYLLLFRQRLNCEPVRTLTLEFLTGKTIRLTDLIQRSQRELTVGPDGGTEFEIPEAPGFAFMEYQVLS